MKGRFLLQKISDTLTYDSDKDEGRLFYSENNRNAYLGTPDGWYPLTGAKIVDDLPNWHNTMISKLFFVSSEQTLYVATTAGFEQVGVGVTEGEADYSSAICMQCTPPSGTIEVNDTYVVCSSASEPVSGGGEDEWSGHENEITVWDGSTWKFSDPNDYQRVLIECLNGYYVWVDDRNKWEEEIQTSYFNYTSSAIYPKDSDSMPNSGGFFEQDSNDDLMPVNDLPGYISLTWEDFEGTGLMPRP